MSADGRSPEVCKVQWVPAQIHVSLTWFGAFAGSVSNTISPSETSHAMEEPPAGGPRSPVSISRHVWPSHFQVSLAPWPDASHPPKSSTTFACGSYAAEALYRPGGVSSGWASVHAVPFQSQVLS